MNYQFLYFGVEDLKECFCGLSTEDFTENGEAANCQGGVGGQWAMNVYEYFLGKHFNPCT